MSRGRVAEQVLLARVDEELRVLGRFGEGGGGRQVQLSEAVPKLFEYAELPGVGHNDEVWFRSYLAERVTALTDAPVPR